MTLSEDKASIGYAGLLSDADIIRAMKERQLVIAPFDHQKPDKRLTPSGFNFSFTKFIVSLNRRDLYRIKTKRNQLYFELRPGDTALALTRETIWVSKILGGTFHSKVGYVSKGLGHVSTTLDPGWYGQLLIAVSNPNRRKIKVVIGNIKGKNIQYNSFITLYLFGVISTAERLSDNEGGRFDMLFDVLLSGRTGKKKNLKRMIDDLRDSIKNKDIPNLNLCNSQGNINVFRTHHDEILRDIESSYTSIAKAYHEANLRGIIFRLLILIIFYAGIVYSSVKFIGDEKIRFIIPVAVALASPWINKQLNQISDRRQQRESKD